MSLIERFDLVDLRRDLHEHPETGWTEFRTTALVAEHLDELGFTIHYGEEVVSPEDRIGVPEPDEIRDAKRRAEREDAPERYLEKVGDVTGLIAEREFGSGGEPLVGVRVDMDALEIREADDDDHDPAREGFRSGHPGVMHACGHDGHTAIGVGIARTLVSCGGYDGTLRLFFQPAEEGGRGGFPMSVTEYTTDVDSFLALHLGLGNRTGRVVTGYDRSFSVGKIDVEFHGESSHAAKAPHEGRNALQAAATAIQQVYAIPRHADGISRVNVGRVHSPNPQNVISDYAEFRVEARGKTDEVRDYLMDRVERVVRSASDMHHVDYESSVFGTVPTFRADRELAGRIAGAVGSIDGVDDVVEREPFPAGEDAAYLINAVQDSGGQATYVGIGADIESDHHTPRFDFDERALHTGVEAVSESIRALGE